MSSLHLIRHGQASFGAADYDVLSQLGIRQSTHLGRYLARRPQHFDAIYTGPRKRQIDTTRHMLDEARAHGADYPEPRVLEELDEYPAFELIEHFMPELARREADVAAVLGGTADPPTIDRVMKRMLTMWANGELTTDVLESFAHFQARVVRGLRHIMGTEGRKRSVAVVTSGGPISIAMKHTLELSADQTMRVGWSIANASISRFRYREDELTLHSFNLVEHLDEPSITYR